MTAPTREPCPVCGRPIERTVASLCRSCWSSYDTMSAKARWEFVPSPAEIVRWAVQRSKRWAKRRGGK